MISTLMSPSHTIQKFWQLSSWARRCVLGSAFLFVFMAGGLAKAQDFQNFSFQSIAPLALASPSIQASNRIGLDLAREAAALQLSETGRVGNQMYSPLSLYNSLSMLQLGVSGQVRDQLNQRLGWQDADMAIQHQSNRMLNNYFQPSTTSIDPNEKRTTAKVRIANSVWGTSGLSTGMPFVFEPSYLDDLRSLYSAESNPFLDFKNSQTAEKMNEWASRKTDGLVSNVMTADALKELVWVLMNATTIEASWKNAFSAVPKSATPPFQTMDGKSVEVDMISTKQNIAAIDIGSFQLAEIPLFNSDLAFFVVVPKSIQDFTSWVKNGDVLDASFWRSSFAQLNKTHFEEVTIVMPKFSFSTSVEFKKESVLTEKIGLGFLFDETNYGDFSPMGATTSVPSVVGLLKQDQRIELDEYGLKAAAVTTVGGIEVTSMPINPPTRIVIDKPFFFAIGSKSTGMILFVGAVADPTLSN